MTHPERLVRVTTTPEAPLENQLVGHSEFKPLFSKFWEPPRPSALVQDGLKFPGYTLSTQWRPAVTQATLD